MPRKDPDAEREYQRKYRAANKARLRKVAKFQPSRQPAQRHAEYLRRKDKAGLYARTKKYGLSEEQQALLFAAQNGKCAICESALTLFQANLDHDHVTGQIRQYLCRTCNVGLGHFKDSQALCEAAAGYLRRHRSD